jgi:hypothetical protein
LSNKLFLTIIIFLLTTLLISCTHTAEQLIEEKSDLENNHTAKKEAIATESQTRQEESISIVSETIQEDITIKETDIIIKSPDLTITKYKGVWLHLIRELRIALDDMENLESDGINIIGIGISIQLDENSNTVIEYDDETEIRNAINIFHENSFEVLLILNPAFPDSGINPNDEYVKGKVLLDKLNPLIIKWADISEQYGIEIFSPINEVQLLSPDNEEDISIWAQELLPEIRNRYNGKIAFRIQYSGEGLEKYNLSGYDYVLFGGLTCVKDIEEHPDWIERTINEATDNLILNYPGQEYLFLDVGAFTGPDYYWWEPIAPANMQGNPYGWPADFFTISYEGQSNFYDMLFELTWDITEGYFVPVYKGWEYRDKPAEEIIRKWFNE